MRSLGQCVKCGAVVNDGSNFCNVCGMPVTAATKANQIDDSTEMKSMLLAGLAGMALFFAFGMTLVAAIAEPGFWTLVIILTSAALLMLLARYVILRSYKKRVEKIEVESIINCQYCGGQNNKKVGKCIFCGAPLK